MQKAVHAVDSTLGPPLLGVDPRDQREVDAVMCALDGTPNKVRTASQHPASPTSGRRRPHSRALAQSALGANAILGVSLAAAKAGAAVAGRPLWLHVQHLANARRPVMPVPAFNIINGGSHAGNALAFQEVMLMPTGAPTYTDALRAGCEVYQALTRTIRRVYGQVRACMGRARRQKLRPPLTRLLLHPPPPPRTESTLETREALPPTSTRRQKRSHWSARRSRRRATRARCVFLRGRHCWRNPCLGGPGAWTTSPAAHRCAPSTQVKFALDVAASEFFTERGKYDIAFKTPQVRRCDMAAPPPRRAMDAAS